MLKENKTEYIKSFLRCGDCNVNLFARYDSIEGILDLKDIGTFSYKNVKIFRWHFCKKCMKNFYLSIKDSCGS